MENTIKFFWNGIKVNGKLNKFNFCLNGDHVSFYEDGYDAEMPAECGVAVINNSDGMTDYFENVRETSDFYGWYHKTDFAIKWTENGEECAYRGRYDLGDGEGGMLNHIRNFGEWSRTHGQFGAVLENPPETNDVLEMVKKFETFAA